MSAITIRRYREQDRSEVRAIAYRVGFMGESAEWYWGDFESFANIWTAYYTDREPASAFVAEREGRVIGFLLGCVDSTRAPSPAKALTREALRRFLFLRPGTARFLWRSVWESLRQGDVPQGELKDPRWPSHLHINLLSEAWGRGVGPALVDAFFARLREVGSPGCHLATMVENTRAVHFFERVGFRRFAPPVLLPGMRLRSGGRMHMQLMVHDLRT